MASILVVDDEPDVLAAIARALRIADHTVEMGGTATQALKLCAEHSFDVVVLDYIMPTMSGIELLNEIRSYTPTIRSVIISGKIDVQESEEAVSIELRNRIEADAYLHKPVNNARLLETIAELLSKSDARSWVDIAERNVNAKKPNKVVKDAERSLKRIKKRGK